MHFGSKLSVLRLFCENDWFCYHGNQSIEGNYIVKIGKALLGFHLKSITDIALQFLGDVRGYIIHIYCEFDENHMVQFLYK